MPKSASKKPEPAFEDALAQLETIVQTLETGEVSLDDLLGEYKRGMDLLRFCQNRLETARQQVETISSKTGDTEKRSPGKKRKPTTHNEDENEIKLF